MKFFSSLCVNNWPVDLLKLILFVSQLWNDRAECSNACENHRFYMNPKSKLHCDRTFDSLQSNRCLLIKTTNFIFENIQTIWVNLNFNNNIHIERWANCVRRTQGWRLAVRERETAAPKTGEEILNSFESILWNFRTRFFLSFSPSTSLVLGTHGRANDNKLNGEANYGEIRLVTIPSRLRKILLLFLFW